MLFYTNKKVAKLHKNVTIHKRMKALAEGLLLNFERACRSVQASLELQPELGWDAEDGDRLPTTCDIHYH